jgi:hypothetical protein
LDASRSSEDAVAKFARQKESQSQFEAAHHKPHIWAWNVRWAVIALVVTILIALPSLLDGTARLDDPSGWGALLVIAAGVYYAICYVRNDAKKDWRRSRREFVRQEEAAFQFARAERAREDELLLAAKALRSERKRQSDLATAAALLTGDPEPIRGRVAIPPRCTTCRLQPRRRAVRGVRQQLRHSVRPHHPVLDGRIRDLREHPDPLRSLQSSKGASLG